MRLKSAIRRVRIYIQYHGRHGLFRLISRVAGDVFYTIAVAIYQRYLALFCPVREAQMVFMSTPSFSDNGKALYEHLLKQKELEHFHYTWLIHRENMPHWTPKELTKVVVLDSSWHRGLTFGAMRQVASGKYIFFTHESPMEYMPARDGQHVINLWHGCGYKDTERKRVVFHQSRQFDVALVPGPTYVSKKAHFWGCPEECILPLGYPRYDWLLAESESGKRLYQMLKGDASRLVVWMPTFRKTMGAFFPEGTIEQCFDLPLLNDESELAKVNQFCRENDLVLCIKRHRRQIEYSCEKEYYSNIRFISNRDFIDADVNLYSFLRYTDALISDYSSAAIDYLLLNRPIAFTLDDLKRYQETRGFVFENPLDYMPGHHLYGLTDMLTFLGDVSSADDPYKDVRARIMPQVHNPCDNYCARIWDAIVNMPEVER